MNTDNIKVNTQSSIRLELDKTIYFDPFKIEDEVHDADIIFVTHSHYDHFDIDSINNIKNENTIIVCPLSLRDEVSSIEFKDYIYLNPDDETSVLGINIKAIRAYNNEKQFHPKSNNWLGYVIERNNTSYYVAGDTDKNEDNEVVKCDIAFLPIGGHFTMDVNEAIDLVRTINPKIAIPTHYGSIIGSISDGEEFKNGLSNTDIEVVLKLQ